MADIMGLWRGAGLTMTAENRLVYLTALRAELDSDPAGRGYADAADAAAVADLLNAGYATSEANPQAGWAEVHILQSALQVCTIGETELTAWDLIDAAGTGKRSDDDPLTGSEWSVTRYYGLKRAYNRLTAHPYLDLGNAQVAALLASWVTDGLLTAAQVTALQALGEAATISTPQTARVVGCILGIPGAPNMASADDVTDARALEV